MPRLHLQLLQQASWLLGWLVCFFTCASAVAQPSTGNQKTPSTGESKATAKKPSIFDFAKQFENSISRLGLIEDKSISESSGLATAAAPGCFWTINDSGNPAEIFLFSSSGRKLAKVELQNAVNKDWESLASFNFSGERWCLVADVGDNQRLLAGHKLYFFRDPTNSVAKLQDDKESFTKKDFKKLKSVQSLSFEFTYQPSLPVESSKQKDLKNKSALAGQDCEAVAVDPTTLDIWFVEKVHLNRDRKVIPGIFVLPMPKSQLAVHAGDLSAAADSIEASTVKPVAKRVGSFPVRYVSGMSFSPDGKKLIIRNYLTAHLFVRPNDKTWQQTLAKQTPAVVALPLQSQGEAICFTEDSRSVIVTSEGVRQPIWKVDLQVYIDKFKKQK